jgi:hypothetical protein
LKEKYTKGYIFYRMAMETMQSNKNTKQFALDASRVKDTQVSIKETGIYSADSLAELVTETRSNQEGDKLVIVSLFNRHLLDRVLEILHKEVISNGHNHFYMLLTMPIGGNVRHGLRFVLEKSHPQQNRHYLSAIEE